MKSIVAIGELLIDFVPLQRGCPLDEVTQFERVAGGAPANVASAVARLGGSAKMVSQVGEDAFGTHIIKSLRENGVDTDFVFRTDRANTALAFVSLTRGGEREFSFYRKPSADLFLDEAQVKNEIFENCAALHFCSVDLVDMPVRRAHQRAIGLARQAGAMISFDPNVRLPLWESAEECRSAIRAFLPCADLVKLSDDEIEFVTGCKSERAAAEQLFQSGCRLLLVTRGENGAAAYTPDEFAEVQAAAAAVADTTGAGDSFVGSFLYQLVRDDVTPERLSALTAEKLSEYLAFSARCAAFTVRHKGAVMPTWEELQKS